MLGQSQSGPGQVDRLLDVTLTADEVDSSFTSDKVLLVVPSDHEALIMGPVYVKKSSGGAFATNTNSSVIKCGAQTTTGADLNNLMLQAGQAITLAPVTVGGNLNINIGGTSIVFRTTGSNPTAGAPIRIRLWYKLLPIA